MFLLLSPCLQACPDCAIQNNTDYVEQASTTAKLALSSNVLLMIGIVVTVLSFMIYSMFKACQDVKTEA
jgi:high-affinity nickel permease